MKKCTWAKLLLAVALAGGLATGAGAWDVTVSGTNATQAVLVLPPVVDARLNWDAYPVRATSVVVTAGARYRIGRQIIVAANEGSITNESLSTTTYVTNGTVVATNTVYTIVPVTVPITGLSAYDGTVRWARAAASRDRARVQVTVGSGCTLVIGNGSGDNLTYSTSAIDDGFVGYEGPLFAYRTGTTNTCTVSVLQW